MRSLFSLIPQEGVSGYVKVDISVIVHWIPSPLLMRGRLEGCWWTVLVIFTWEVTTAEVERKAQCVGTEGSRVCKSFVFYLAPWPPYTLLEDLDVELLWAALVNVGSQDATRVTGNANHLKWRTWGYSLRMCPGYFLWYLCSSYCWAHCFPVTVEEDTVPLCPSSC